MPTHFELLAGLRDRKPARNLELITKIGVKCAYLAKTRVMELTKEERNAIASFKRLAKRWPDSLPLYVIDGDCIVVCKRGVPSGEYSETVDLRIGPGAVITDMHDDMDCGRE